MGLRRKRVAAVGSSAKRESALGASRWLNYVGPVGVWPRPETVQLFGCYVVARRQAFGVSQEGLADSARRSSEWVANVERGACCPTDAGFIALTLGFDEATGVAPDDLRLVFDRLDIEPYGELATTLRARFSLDPPAIESTETSIPSSSWVPIASETRYHDRLTTVPPLFVLVATLYLSVFGKPWRGSGFDLPVIGLSDVLLISTIAVTAIAAALPRLSEGMGALCSRLRPRGVRKNHERCQKIRGSQRGINVIDWFVDDESPFLVARYRNEARQKSLEADLVERTTLALFVSVALIATSLALSVNSSTSAGSWSPWLMVLTILMLFALVTHRWWLRLSKVLPEILADGYGARASLARVNDDGQGRDADTSTSTS